MHAPINPFQHRRTKTRAAGRVVFWMIRLGTYGVLAAAACIFSDIAWKGGKVVFQSAPPYVNVPFLTEKPQTLYVFEYEGKKMEMSDAAALSGQLAGIQGIPPAVMTEVGAAIKAATATPPNQAAFDTAITAAKVQLQQSAVSSSLLGGIL